MLMTLATVQSKSRCFQLGTGRSSLSFLRVPAMWWIFSGVLLNFPLLYLKRMSNSKGCWRGKKKSPVKMYRFSFSFFFFFSGSFIGQVQERPIHRRCSFPPFVLPVWERRQTQRPGGGDTTGMVEIIEIVFRQLTSPKPETLNASLQP